VDNTVNMQTEKELQRAFEKSLHDQQMLSALLIASRSVFESRKFRQTARSIFDCCKNITGATAGYVALLSADGSENDVLFLDSGGVVCSVNPNLPMPIRGLRAKAYQSGKVVYDNDFAASSWMEYLPAGHSPLNNVLFAPLLIEEKPVGLFGLANKPTGFTENDVETVTAFAQLASISLANVRNIEALEEREELFRTIFETSPDAISINRISDGLFIKINQGVTALTGYTKEDVIEKTIFDIKIWHNAKRRTELMALLEKKGEVRNFEATFRRKDGRIIPGQISARLIHLHNEPHVLAVSRDISELKKAERARKKYRQDLEKRVVARTAELAATNTLLHRQIKERMHIEKALIESEKKYSSLIEASLTGIYITQDDRIAFANERFAEMHGYSRQELLHMDALLLVHPDERALVKRIRNQRLQGKPMPAEYEIRGLRKDGEVIWVIRRNTLISYQGKPAILGNVADITERKKMEEALVRSENELRFLSARLLSAEERERKRIARELHDGIGQALTAIKFSVENMVRTLSERQIDFDRTSIQATVPLIRQTIDEVRRIIMDLRPSTLDDLGILATISWFTRELGEIYSGLNIEKKIAIAEEEIPLPLKTVLFRIMQEALNNAAKHSQAQQVILCLEKLDRKIVLLIEDNGKGFDAEKTQSLKQGTQGLGLASMRERVLLSGGVFSLKTTPGKGTSICAIWPPEAIWPQIET
jgi:PAS domain S-box-containing protein